MTNITIEWGVYKPPSNEDPQWVDEPADITVQFDKITDSPSTQRPSLRPSTAPSRAPTVSPSSEPSMSSEPAMTHKPSSEPSMTHEPSSEPSMTHEPSASPTDGPTAAPSTEPSASPTTNSTTDSNDNKGMNTGSGSSENTPQNTLRGTGGDGADISEVSGENTPQNTPGGTGGDEADISEVSGSSQRTYVSRSQDHGDTAGGVHIAIEAPQSGDGGSEGMSGVAPFKAHIIIGVCILGGLTALLALLLTSRRRKRRNASPSTEERDAGQNEGGGVDTSRHPHYVIDKFDNSSIINASYSDDSSMDSQEGEDEAISVASKETEIVWSFSQIERQGSLQPTEDRVDNICM